MNRHGDLISHFIVSILEACIMFSGWQTGPGSLPSQRLRHPTTLRVLSVAVAGALPEEPDASPAPCRKAASFVFTADVRSGEAAAELRWRGNAAEGRPAAVAVAACTWARLRPAPMGRLLDLQHGGMQRTLSRDKLPLRSPCRALRAREERQHCWVML